MKFADYIPIVIALIGAAVPGLLALIKMRSQVRRDNSDAAESLSNAAAALIKPFSERVDKLEKDRERDKVIIEDHYFRLRVSNAYIDHLLQVIQVLTKQLVDAKIIPECSPMTIEEIEKTIKREA